MGHTTSPINISAQVPHAIPFSEPVISPEAETATQPDVPAGPYDHIVEPIQVQEMLSAQVAVDFRSQINHMCQKVSGGQIRAGELVYETKQVGARMQATLQLMCLEAHGQPTFAGNVCADKKTAEKDAALQAIKFFMPLYQDIVFRQTMRKGPVRQPFHLGHLGPPVAHAQKRSYG